MKTRTTERAIGEHCASLIKDGDTLQLGIGSIPDAVLQSLRDKKDLGIHSEMFSDGVVELAEAGEKSNPHRPSGFPRGAGGGIRKEISLPHGVV